MVLSDAARSSSIALVVAQVLEGAVTFSYADLAVALVDQAVLPTRAGEVVAVG